MGTFTNIARNVTDFLNSTPTNQGWSSKENGVGVPKLYEDYNLYIQTGRNVNETTCSISNFLRTGIVSGHVYYGCYWCQARNDGTKTTDLYVGQVDSEADLLVGQAACPKGRWARASGVRTLYDNGKASARVDYNGNNTSYIGCLFSGFLVVDLTASGLADKTKEWCDDHLYWVPSGSSGTFTDYDAEGAKGQSSDSGNPSVSTLVTYHNYAAQKSNRSGTTVAAAPAQSSASWANAVYNAQTAMTTKGSTYGTCGVVKLTPANFTTISAPSANSTSFSSSGRGVINTLIRNADALYAQQYCVQRKTVGKSTSCYPDDCGDCSDCGNCSDGCASYGCNDCCEQHWTCEECNNDCCEIDGCKWDCCDSYKCSDDFCRDYCPDCCEHVCLVRGCCDTVCCYSDGCDNCCDAHECSNCCDGDCCDGYSYEICSCQSVCSCDSVCACNWV